MHYRQTRQDMDESSSCLIAAHGYCSQDLVNLFLTGHAVTNCFDGSHNVTGQLCRGIQHPCQLGFLSLFEHFGYMQVGRCVVAGTYFVNYGFCVEMCFSTRKWEPVYMLKLDPDVT